MLPLYGVERHVDACRNPLIRIHHSQQAHDRGGKELKISPGAAAVIAAGEPLRDEGVVILREGGQKRDG